MCLVTCHIVCGIQAITVRLLLCYFTAVTATQWPVYPAEAMKSALDMITQHDPPGKFVQHLQISHTHACWAHVTCCTSQLYQAAHPAQLSNLVSCTHHSLDKQQHRYTSAIPSHLHARRDVACGDVTEDMSARYAESKHGGKLALAAAQAGTMSHLKADI